MIELLANLQDQAGAGAAYLTLGLIFVITTGLAWMLMRWLFSGQNALDRRLDDIAHGATQTGATRQEDKFVVKILAPAAKLALPKEGWQQSRIKTKLVRGGYRSPQAMPLFLSAKVLTAIALPVLSLLILIVSGSLGTDTRLVSIFLLVMSALIGYFLPDFIVDRKIAARQISFIEQFPDAMDMLVVCVEAGLSLDAAVQRVGKEMATSHPELAGEFNLLSLELRAGKSRQEGLRALAERTGVDEVKSLTTLLIQAEQFGTSIAGALREHSNEMRVRRMQRAREKAAKLPVKLLFPVLCFIFPALFLVILGPAVVRIYEVLFKMSGAG